MAQVKICNNYGWKEKRSGVAAPDLFLFVSVNFYIFAILLITYALAYYQLLK